MNRCGPNGVCACLRGFAPRSPEAWAPRVKRVGCVGAMALDCRNGISGFVPMKRGKVPDTTAIVVDFGAILADCAQRCPRDCSCTAYASAKLSGTPRTSTLEDLRVFPNFSQEPRTSMCAFRCRSRRVTADARHDPTTQRAKGCAMDSLSGLSVWVHKDILMDNSYDGIAVYEVPYTWIPTHLVEIHH